METIFENQFIHTKKYYSEYYKYTYLKRPLILVINIILSITLIITILSIIFPAFFVMTIANITANILTILITWCIQIYIFYRSKNISYSRDLETNNGNPVEATLSVTNDNINISKNSAKDININLANIEKVIKTKNYYILVSKAKLGIVFKKDSFIKGTAKEFEEFLKQKRIMK